MFATARPFRGIALVPAGQTGWRGHVDDLGSLWSCWGQLGKGWRSGRIDWSGRGLDVDVEERVENQKREVQIVDAGWLQYTRPYHSGHKPYFLSEARDDV